MIEDFVPSIFLLVFVTAHVFLERRKWAADEEFVWQGLSGPYGLHALVSFFILLWILPGGFFLAGTVLLLLSILSPAGRMVVHSHPHPRLTALV